MQLKPKTLPPMSSLRPFEAAARHLSFSRAAEDIGVTQAAVSKQIRALEQYLGHKLFIRNTRKVELTNHGHILQHAVSLGLTHISRATSQILQQPRSNQVSIAMRLPFASQFMAPRLTALRSEFPEIEFNIVSTERNPFSLVDSVDMAIVLGYEAQPGLVSDHVLDEEIFPVCSPSYAARHPELRSVEDIPDQTLIHLAADNWRDLSWEPADWPVVARALGVTREVDLQGPSFNNYEMLMSAAVSGLGLAVAWQHLGKDLLDQGHLVRPVPGSYRIDRKHYMVTHSADADNVVIRQLRQWILAETACFRLGG